MKQIVRQDKFHIILEYTDMGKSFKYELSASIISEVLYELRDRLLREQAILSYNIKDMKWLS